MGVGETLAIRSTSRSVALVAVPSGVTTVIRPLLTPGFRVASIRRGDATVNASGTPFTVTAVAPMRLVPWICTVVAARGGLLAPPPAFGGVKPVILGGTS